MKKSVVSLIISSAVGISVLGLWWFGALDTLENRVTDSHFKIRGAVKPFADIVIISIDEDSIKTLGRWPWPRDIHAKLIDKLTAADAKTIVFDVLFTEPDKDRPGADQELGRAIKRSGRVVLGSFFQMGENAVAAKEYTPIEILAKNSSTGFTNTFTELDGVNRKVPLLMEYEGAYVPSLALMGLSAYFGKPPADLIKEKNIVIDEYNEMLVNYAGGYESFPYFSYAAVLSGETPAETFKNKIVLVGGTATGLFDLKAIPFSPSFPGVEIHSNAISNIVLGNYLAQWTPLLTVLFVIGFAVLSGIVFGSISPWKGGVSAAAVFAAYFLMTQLLFGKNIMAEFVAPALSLSLSYVGVLFFRFMTEEKEKRQIKKNFSHYFSPKVMERILSDPSHLTLGGQKKNLTVLFSDIRNFTTISESMDSQKLVAQLNEYLTKMVEVVFKHDGTSDKFIGDAVMAFWGAPVPQEDHPRRAVMCAIEMLEELEKLKEKWNAEGTKIFDIGIGVNSGEMTVGNMGSKQKMEYTVIGDNVNLGSRLESLNKEYKTKIIVSEATYEAVRDLVEAEPLGAVKVKGKNLSVNIYTILGRKGERKFARAAEGVSAEHAKAPSASKKEERFDPEARLEIQKKPHKS